MSPQVWRLYGAAACRALDRHTIDTLGVPGIALMESAGHAVANEVLADWSEGDAAVVVCGTGNNGGDGFVVARLLHGLGLPVRAALIGAADSLAGDAAAHFEAARAAGVRIEAERWRAPARGVIVDALFGTGLSRGVTGAKAASIRRINAARTAGRGGVRVIAVDLPSGLCADTGRAQAAAVHADVCVTIQVPKPGLVLEPGRSLAGRIVVARIGIAEPVQGVAPDACVLTRASAGALLPERPATGHKGSFGHVLVAAGSEGKTGAAALAAEAAARSGAGLVTIACPAGLNDILEIKCTEAMTVPVADTSERAFSADAAAPLLALAEERSAVAFGPGIGRSDETVKLVRSVAPRICKPLVLDADGLFAFAGQPELLAARTAPLVLTPHPGEAALLLGTTAAYVNRARVEAARSLAAATRGVVLLKGAATVIAAPDGRLRINPTGGPALGAGGTGDVLTGIVAALLAQGLEAFEAASLGAFVHGAAGDALAATDGDSGLLAGDLARALPGVCARLRSAAIGAGGPGSSLAVSFPEP